MIVLKKCDIFFKLNLSSRTILGFKNGTSYKNFHKTHSYTFSDKNEGNTDPKLINQNKNLNPKKLETTIKESDNPSETLDQTKTSHEPFNFQKLFEKNLKVQNINILN